MDFTCYDVVTFDDKGVRQGQTPRFLRCDRGGCDLLITRAMLEQHRGCCPGRTPGVSCGNRKYRPATNVTEDEQQKILSGEIPTPKWEMQLITGEITPIELGEKGY